MTGTGSVAAKASTTQSLVLEAGAAYLVTASVTGDHTDERQTYVVHVPIAGNLNVSFKSLLADSYVWTPQAAIAFSTQDGGGGWQSNGSSNYTLKITFTAGLAADTWAYSAVRIL